MWAAGNKHPARAARGLTLLEMLVVVAIIALGTLGVSLALRDNNNRLDREAQRLVALLDAARAQSQAMGVPVLLKLADNGFVLEGLPNNTFNTTPSNTSVPNAAPNNVPIASLPHAWLYPDTAAHIIRITNNNTSPTNALLLGPEPIIPAQALRLVSRESGAQLVLRTDGLHSFQISSGAAP
jgi:general secretion pathway protein H